MNEELKIIIRAITNDAKKNIQDVKKELGGLDKEGSKASAGLGKSFKGIGVAAVAVVGTIAAVGTALVALGRNTKEFREEQAKLNTAFLAAGSTTEQASKTYNGLFRFLGQSDIAVEASNHLAKLTTSEKDLAEWTKICQGVYATFGDSLKIESFTEAANETAKVAKVTGTFADALNWAGISEDAFNQQLAALNTEAEREALIRQTLTGIYSDAANIYEKVNADIIAQNEAQARLDGTTARLGRTVQPLITALTNLSNNLLTALAPAINAISTALTWLINKISQAVQWINAFFGLIGGGKKAGAEVFKGMATNVNTAVGGVGALQDNLKGATGQAEKLKKATMGFDELNVLTNNSSAGSGGSGGSTGGGGGASIGTVPSIDTSGIDIALDETSSKFDNFIVKLKKKFGELKTIFAPTINGFKDVFKQIGAAITESLPSFNSGLEGFKTGFGNLFNYLATEFIPNIVNNWSENFLPIFGDVSSWGILELGTHFEWLGQTFSNVVNDIIIPVLETFETITTDVMSGVKKAWDETGTDLLSNLSVAFAGLRKTIDEFYKDFLKPIIDIVVKWLNEMWQKHLKPLWDSIVSAVLDISNNITILWNKVLQPIIDWVAKTIYPVIKKTVEQVLDKVSIVIQTISGIIQGVVQVIKGVIQFITGVFTGDWKKAWEGVKNIVAGIWQQIWSAIKGVINFIIDGINSLWSGIYTAVRGIINTIGKVADKVGDLLGQNWGFSMPSAPPRIPRLAKGGIVTSETLARIGEGGKKEAVLPLEQNTGWMDSLAEKLSSKINTPSRIVLKIGERELGYAAINSINGITRQTGELQLELV